jgi:hypothetical protein
VEQRERNAIVSCHIWTNLQARLKNAFGVIRHLKDSEPIPGKASFVTGLKNTVGSEKPPFWQQFFLDAYMMQK